MNCGMRKCLSVLLSLILALALAGCGASESSGGGEETSAETESAAAALEGGYLVTDVYGDGQKPWYVVLDYGSEIDPDSVSADDYEVENYDIEAVYVNTGAELPDESTAGNYVLLELSTDYTTANYGGSGSGGADLSGGFSDGSSEDTEALGGETPEGVEDFDGEMPESLGDFDGETPEDFEGDLPQIVDDADAAGDADIGDREVRSGEYGSGEKEDRSGTDSSDASGSSEDGTGNRGGGAGRGSMSGSSSASNQLTVTCTQTGSISCADGTEISAWSESCTTDYTENVNLLVENFTQDTLTLSDGTAIMYSLYLPEDYSGDTEYPLVLFMPDATGEGSDEYLTLTESLGGVIWTTDEWQSEYETIVLVPQYEDSNTEDPVYTMELVTEICGLYSVDSSREYLVGQSSGTIRSIKLLIDYPDEFAGALLVAGQTDSAYTDYISQLSTQNIWMICSEGDARAYPGMTEITEAVETAGTAVTTAQWSAVLSDEEQEQLAAEQASAGTSINWTIFDTGTVMRDDVTSSDATEHMNTWRVAYNLDTVREWLFEQTK
ncbi:MAG: hypothetical protein LIO75_07060 [Lachnospiraceae bacterium]|nr:hypothetical protein [Lachnospiraceae bacterium]